MIRYIASRAAVGFAKFLWISLIVAAVSLVGLGVARAFGWSAP